MKFKQLKKIHTGEYLTRYDLEYETENGTKKIYEIISRDPDLQTFESLLESKTDAAVLIIHDEKREKILLNREYRMAVGRFIYNFPAGLTNSGETVEEAAKRELFEETGLELVHIDEKWNTSYSAIGFSNEKTTVMIGTAKGVIRPSDSDAEEIEARWYTKKETAELLKHEYFAARTQAYCALWCRG